MAKDISEPRAWLWEVRGDRAADLGGSIQGTAK